MKVKALKSFIGKVSMNIHDELDIVDKEILNDLLKAGHVIEVKEAKQKTKQVEEETKEEVKEAE